jgi:6-phosphogluconolactonase
MQVVVVPTAAEAAEAAAERIARRLAGAVRRQGTASVALSGGSTPKAMLAVLATLSVPWAQVHAFQVDERVAPDGDPDRNIGLLDVLPLPKRNLHPMPVTAADLRAAARRYAKGLPERFDVVDLGLGDDGHTASWPPGDPVVAEGAAVALVGPFNGRLRMTLTPPAVNGGRSRIVLVTGEAKAPAVAAWLEGSADLPIRHVRRTATTVVLDAAAAGALAMRG